VTNDNCEFVNSGGCGRVRTWLDNPVNIAQRTGSSCHPCVRTGSAACTLAVLSIGSKVAGARTIPTYVLTFFFVKFPSFVAWCLVNFTWHSPRATRGIQETAYPGLERNTYEKLCMEQVLATKTQQVRWAARMCFGGKCVGTVVAKIPWLLTSLAFCTRIGQLILGSEVWIFGSSARICRDEGLNE
jgi:hypothetical protein